MIPGEGECAACHRGATVGQLLCRGCWVRLGGIGRRKVLTAHSLWLDFTSHFTLADLRAVQREAVEAVGGTWDVEL